MWTEGGKCGVVCRRTCPPPPHVQRHVIVNGKVTYMFTPPPCCGVCLSCVPPPPAAVQLYVIRNGEVSQTIIQLESPAVGLTRLNKDVMVRGVEGHRGDGGGVGKKGGRALSMRVQVGCVVRGKGAGGSLSPTIALSPPPPPPLPHVSGWMYEQHRALLPC